MRTISQYALSHPSSCIALQLKMYREKINTFKSITENVGKVRNESCVVNRQKRVSKTYDWSVRSCILNMRRVRLCTQAGQCDGCTCGRKFSLQLMQWFFRPEWFGKAGPVYLTGFSSFLCQWYCKWSRGKETATKQSFVSCLLKNPKIKICLATFIFFFCFQVICGQKITWEQSRKFTHRLLDASDNPADRRETSRGTSHRTTSSSFWKYRTLVDLYARMAREIQPFNLKFWATYLRLKKTLPLLQAETELLRVHM